MAQSFGRDPSRPFAALAAPEGLRRIRSRSPHSAVPTKRRCASFANRKAELSDSAESGPFEARIPSTREGVDLRAGALLVREWKGKLERVTVLEKGFAWNGKSYSSLSQIAKAMTGTAWNGHRFFGLRTASPPALRKRAAGW